MSGAAFWRDPAALVGRRVHLYFSPYYYNRRGDVVAIRDGKAVVRLDGGEEVTLPTLADLEVLPQG